MFSPFTLENNIFSWYFGIPFGSVHTVLEVCHRIDIQKSRLISTEVWHWSANSDVHFCFSLSISKGESQWTCDRVVFAGTIVCRKSSFLTVFHPRDLETKFVRSLVIFRAKKHTCRRVHPSPWCPVFVNLLMLVVSDPISVVIESTSLCCFGC